MATKSTVSQNAPIAPKAPRSNAPGAIKVCVRDGSNPVQRGGVSLYLGTAVDKCSQVDLNVWSDDSDDWELIADNGYELENGCYEFASLKPGVYVVSFDHVILDQNGQQNQAERLRCVAVEANCTTEACFDLGIGAVAKITAIGEDCQEKACTPCTGDIIRLAVLGNLHLEYHDWIPPDDYEETEADYQAEKRADGPGIKKETAIFRIASNKANGDQEAVLPLRFQYSVAQRAARQVAGNLTVSHMRRVAEPDATLGFFVRLLDASASLGFNFYREFIDRVFECKTGGPPGENAPCFDRLAGPDSKLIRMERELTDHGVGAYELLRTATEAFLLIRCCVSPCVKLNEGSFPPEAWPLSYNTNPDLGDYREVSSKRWQTLLCSVLGSRQMPYIQRVVDTAFPEYGITQQGQFDQRFCADVLLRSRVENPCFLELIWNYWHEEGMLVQSINAVSRRFQNLRAPGQRDPLAHVEIDPLRPLNNILWGYVEEERDRLSIKRRGYEYHHQYGLSLYGKAVADLRPADNRSKFIEAFHNLLNRCADYYRAKQDTTVDPDGYPILHAIQELNLILAQGAHNQFGDLAWTSRVEMLMQEWIMARPEMRDFLQSRAMVPYKEAWMPQVDTMKTLQGWSDVVVTHFRDLGVFGEQIMLTIRWYNWYDITSEEEAKGWADLLRAQIQSYIHAYRAVTGVDLSTMDGVDYTMPSIHLRKRLALQHRAR